MNDGQAALPAVGEKQPKWATNSSAPSPLQYALIAPKNMLLQLLPMLAVLIECFESTLAPISALRQTTITRITRISLLQMSTCRGH